VVSEAPRRRGYGPERLTDCGDDYVRVDLLDAAEKRIADLEKDLSFVTNCLEWGGFSVWKEDSN